MRDFNRTILLPAVCLIGALAILMLANVTVPILVWVCTRTHRTVNRQWQQAFRR